VTTDDELRRMTIGEPRRHDAPIALVEYDPAWPLLYAREADRIRAALGDRVVLLEHTGSTSVPGLAAKPIIDMTLAVADTTAEGDYVPPLEAAGYVLRIREPDWYEHRMLRGTDPEVNLHVFSTGCEEIGRMLRFRDRLRSSPEDRALYLARKRELATRTWRTRRTTPTRRARWWRRSWRGADPQPRSRRIHPMKSRYQSALRFSDRRCVR
jgi:GrpB-like predicted nucleotidyltransferase (UPF0157 family)